MSKNKHNNKSGNSSPKGEVTKFLLKEIQKRTLKYCKLETVEELKAKYNNKKIFELALKVNTATNSAICEALDLKQKSTTRYKRELEKSGRLIELIPRSKKVRCPITGFIASFLTTSSNLINGVNRD